jgi:hypothetical protein
MPKILALFSLMLLQRISSNRPAHAEGHIGGIVRHVWNFRQVWKERLYVQTFTRKVPDQVLQDRILLVNWRDLALFAGKLITEHGAVLTGRAQTIEQSVLT